MLNRDVSVLPKAKVDSIESNSNQTLKPIKEETESTMIGRPITCSFEAVSLFIYIIDDNCFLIFCSGCINMQKM